MPTRAAPTCRRPRSTLRQRAAPFSSAASYRTAVPPPSLRKPRPRTAWGPMAGLMLSPAVSVATGLTQGCMPIGPVRRIDEARDNIVMVIDGRPAATVFIEDIGPELARDMRRVGGVIFAGLPVAGSDTGDYL